MYLRNQEFIIVTMPGANGNLSTKSALYFLHDFLFLLSSLILNQFYSKTRLLADIVRWIFIWFSLFNNSTSSIGTLQSIFIKIIVIIVTSSHIYRIITHNIDFSSTLLLKIGLYIKRIVSGIQKPDFCYFNLELNQICNDYKSYRYTIVHRGLGVCVYVLSCPTPYTYNRFIILSTIESTCQQLI